MSSLEDNRVLYEGEVRCGASDSVWVRIIHVTVKSYDKWNHFLRFVLEPKVDCGRVETTLRFP